MRLNLTVIIAYIREGNGDVGGSSTLEDRGSERFK